MRELMAAMVGFIIGALAMLAVSGCAVVEYYDSDGALAKRAIAATPLTVFPTPDAPAVRVRGIGAIYDGGDMAAIGYYDKTAIKPRRQCAAYVFVNRADEALRWAAMRQNINRICYGVNQ